MDKRPHTRYCLLVQGLDESVDWALVRNIFGQFGTVTKCFRRDDIAKVYYSNQKELEIALSETSRKTPWTVTLFDDRKQVESEDRPGAANMYNEDFESLEENYDYVDVHGRSLLVYQKESGEILVPLIEMRKTGFCLYRKDNFNIISADTKFSKQQQKAFELHMLAEARNYLLQNRVKSTDEDHIINTIKRCEDLLLGETKPDFPEVFSQRRSISNTNNTITITSNAHSPRNNVASPSPRNDVTSSSPSFAEHRSPPKNNVPQMESTPMRPPKPTQIEEKPHLNDSKDFKRSNSTKSDISLPEADDNNMECVELKTGEVYEVLITFCCDKERANVFYVSLSENIELIEDIMLKIHEAEQTLKTVAPKVGSLCIAPFEGVWYRAKVLKMFGMEPLVSFVDYGNRSKVTKLKPIPKSVKDIPLQAIRINFPKTQSLSEGDKITISMKKVNSDGSYFVDLVDDKKQDKPDTRIRRSVTPDMTLTETTLTTKNVEPPRPKSYSITPKPLHEIQNGDKVLVQDRIEDKLVLRSRQCFVLAQEITRYISGLDRNLLENVPDVKKGDLVLSSKDGMPGFYRAVVEKVEGTVVYVKYVDETGQDTLAKKSLRNVDEWLSKQPATLLLSPSIKILPALKGEAEKKLSEIIDNKFKLSVILDDDFDLQLPDGDTLLTQLNQLNSPAPAKPKQKINEETPVKSKEPQVKPAPPASTEILYETMDFYEPALGENTYMCCNFNDEDVLTLLPVSEKETQWLNEIWSMEVEDNVPFKPKEAFQMCLASYKGKNDNEAAWYRGVVMEIKGNETYNVYFVDFGNMEDLKAKDLRQFPVNWKDIPILGFSCEFVGIPNKPAIFEKLHELMVEGETYTVNVKEKEEGGLKYFIEIPEVYEKLKKEKLY